MFALAKIMGVHIIEYDADNGVWGYYAGNNGGCEDGAIYTWFETCKDNEAHSMLVVGDLNKPKEPKPKSRRYSGYPDFVTVSVISPATTFCRFLTKGSSFCLLD